jgi:hypothetical protein
VREVKESRALLANYSKPAGVPMSKVPPDRRNLASSTCAAIPTIQHYYLTYLVINGIYGFSFSQLEYMVVLIASCFLFSKLLTSD